MASIKRYRYRAYPTKGQAHALSCLYGCCRFVYNRFVAVRETMFKVGGRMPTFTQLARDLTQSKNDPDTSWLKTVSAVPLQQSLRHARTAYDNYFAWKKGDRKGPEVGKPTFKTRRGTQSAEFTLNSRFKLEHEPGCKWAFLTLPKVGRVKLRWTRDLPTVPKTVTVIRRPCGRYEASFTTITTSRITPKALHAEAGVDIGLLSLGVVRRSDGTCEAIENPRFLKNSERRLRHLDRELARKRKGSRNYEKACTRRARACQKVKDTRLDYLTKTARRLIDENQAIALETLSITGLAKTRLGKSVLDAGWCTLIRLVTQMGREAGRDIRRISRWYASTQTCCVCHVKDKPKPLNIREWDCPNCGARLDRDANAAVNIMLAAGLAESLNACGGDVNRKLAMPAATSTPMKQEPSETIPPPLRGTS